MMKEVRQVLGEGRNEGRIKEESESYKATNSIYYKNCKPTALDLATRRSLVVFTKAVPKG